MLDTILETEERENMILFEKYLTRLYQGKRISKETALKAAFRASEIKKLIP
jgi:Tfp pilus assembly pilus retraction ATPase PilT